METNTYAIEITICTVQVIVIIALYDIYNGGAKKAFCGGFLSLFFPFIVYKILVKFQKNQSNFK